MKKFLALILALVMVFSLAGVAFAETIEDDGKDGNYENQYNITVNVNKGSTVYFVQIKWGDLVFNYNGTATWDPDEHVYNHSEGAGLAKNTTTITVINHSNAAVNTTATLTEDNGRGFKAELDKTSASLERADLATTSLNDPDKAPTVVYTVTMSGQPDDAFLAELAALKENDEVPTVNVGTIKVIVSPAA
jgi:hypothetical protein